MDEIPCRLSSNKARLATSLTASYELRKLKSCDTFAPLRNINESLDSSYIALNITAVCVSVVHVRRAAFIFGNNENLFFSFTVERFLSVSLALLPTLLFLVS